MLRGHCCSLEYATDLIKQDNVSSPPSPIIVEKGGGMISDFLLDLNKIRICPICILEGPVYILEGP